MKKIYKLKEIELNNGVAKYDKDRTVSSITGLSPETQLEYIGTQSRMKGTGYNDSLYRICGTDDLLRVCHNDGPLDNLEWDNVLVQKDYFADQRAYGRRVGELTRQYGLPFEVGLALGLNETLYVEFLNHLDNESLESVTIGTLRDLYAGIWRRKEGLRAVLGEELFEALHIEWMGQQHSTRLAKFVAKCCERCLKR